MKTTIILSVLAIVFASCAEKAPERYTQASPEINTMKQSVKDYEQADWTAMRSHFSDTASIHENSITPVKPDAYIENHKGAAELYASRDFPDDEEEYEMVLTDGGETWVNFWGRFVGTLKANQKKYEIPVHITARFVDGSIVSQHIYYDISPVAMDLDMIERAAAEMAENSGTSE